MKPIQIGLFNRRIAVQTQSSSQDSLGQPIQIWQTAYQCWASIDIQSSQLLYSTAEFIAKTTHRITLRYTSSFQFAPSQRISYTEQTTNTTHIYTIEAILNANQGNRQITLLCYELNGPE